jgi:hypothetical protein
MDRRRERALARAIRRSKLNDVLYNSNRPETSLITNRYISQAIAVDTVIITTNVA